MPLASSYTFPKQSTVPHPFCSFEFKENDQPNSIESSNFPVLFLSNKTAQIDILPSPIYEYHGTRGGWRCAWVDCLCHLPAPSQIVPYPFACHVRIFQATLFLQQTCYPRHARPTLATPMLRVAVSL